MTSFNLIEQPWIPALGLDDSVTTHSIQDIFRNAHQLQAIAAELPTSSAAILRLLLAIGLRAAQPISDDPVQQWADWWRSGGIPADLVDEYLGRYRDRFDLLDCEQPFFQIADLHTAKGATSGLERIIAEGGTGSIFRDRSGESLTSLSFAEAARWVVHAQAWDIAGIKTGVVGDERAKGGKSYSFGIPAWTGNCGIIIIEGKTLAETLLLNLTLGFTSADDLPVWERPPQEIPSDGIYRIPQGPADVFTWPSRMIRLYNDGERITDAIVSNGEKLEAQNRFNVEPMTSWRFSKPQTEKHKIEVWMPREHPPGQAMWRGLPGLLATHPSGQSDTRAKPAESLQWLNSLREDVIAPDATVVLQAVGTVYGPQNSTVADIIADTMSFQIAAITDEQVRQAAVDASYEGVLAVRALSDFTRNLCRAAGGRDAATGADEFVAERRRVTTDAYARLGLLFDDWLKKLTQDVDLLNAGRDWQQRVWRCVDGLGKDLITQAPSAALVGREVNMGNDRTERLDAALAQVWFRGNLRRILTLLADPRKRHDEEKTSV